MSGLCNKCRWGTKTVKDKIYVFFCRAKHTYIYTVKVKCILFEEKKEERQHKKTITLEDFIRA